MALIMVTGLPCSGKSITAQRIADCLREKLKAANDTRQVRIVSDQDTLDWDGRNAVYMSIAKEKELRSWLRAEAQRYINLNQIVILDSAAYIKGFRYELFCMTKEAKGHYCIVELLLDEEVCLSWNSEKAKPFENTHQDPNTPKSYYDKETFDALVLRYEKCDESNRWDSPLFRLKSENDKLNIDELFNVITSEQPLMPNKCTSLTTTATTIFKPTK